MNSTEVNRKMERKLYMKAAVVRMDMQAQVSDLCYEGKKHFVQATYTRMERLRRGFPVIEGTTGNYKLGFRPRKMRRSPKLLRPKFSSAR